jgi:hypothetical protein
MQIPVETKPALWGALGGAVAMAIVGFSWGGWVTGGKSETAAALRASSAVTAALAPVCVAKFQGASDATTNLAALKKADTWQQGDFVEKGGWATMPGTAQPPEQLSAVAKACATLLLPA